MNSVAIRTALTLLLATACVVALGVDRSIAADPGVEGLPAGVLASVAEVPPALGTVTAAEFHRSLAQVSAQAGISPAPRAGDRRYRRFAQQALEDRLDSIWIQGEASELGLSVTQRQISKRLAAIKSENFKSEAEYRRFLREAKLTEAETRERVELQILSRRIQETVVKGARTSKEARRRFTKFVEEYSQRWKARTICAERYATDRCSNGPLR